MQRTLHQKGLGLLLISILFIHSLVAQRFHQVQLENQSTFQHQTRNTTIATARSNIREANRRIDGTNNNLLFPQWGATDIALARSLPADYDRPDRLNSMAGRNRKSARDISNQLCQQSTPIPSSKNLNSLVFTWGQFIDHDITLSGESHTEAAPISLPTDETAFSTPISFHRSTVMPHTGQTSPREQMNLITSWLDASMVYGSDNQRANWLRTYKKGKLKISEGKLLPYNTHNRQRTGNINPNAPSMATIPSSAPTHFVAGDVRANEQPGLTTLHTLFVREHNWYCNQLIKAGLSNDEEIYQLARKWVSGVIQNITFTEFLPTLGVELDAYQGYNPNIRPDIRNEFATAAFRFGHTLVTNDLVVVDDQCHPIYTNTSLVGNFFNNHLIQTFGVEAICRGLAMQVQEEIDLKVVNNLRNFLFQIPGGPSMGLDLAALNIQRGRDHGLPDYNTLRQHFTGVKAKNFSEIIKNRSTKLSLKAAYDNKVNNIDPWIGLLVEDKIKGTSIGPTMYAMLKMQFQALRDGDYYYYENDPFLPAAIKKEIRKTGLAKIIERNTTIKNMHNKIFKARACKKNNTNNNGGSVISASEATGNRMGQLEEQLYAPTSKDTIGSLSSFELFPNPASEAVFVNLTAYHGQEVKLFLYNQVGQLVQQSTIEKVVDSLHQLATHDLRKGLYFVTLKVEGQSAVGKKLLIDRM